MKIIFIRILTLVCITALLFCSASGCSFVKDIFAPEPSPDPSATAVPEKIEFKGFDTVLEIPIGTEEGCIAAVTDDEGNCCIPELRAVSDDEFIIIDAIGLQLLFVDREGGSRTVSLKDCCTAPKRVAYDSDTDTIAVLDQSRIVFLNSGGEVVRTEGLPQSYLEYYFGFTAFEFIDGKLELQLSADYAYMLNDNGYIDAHLFFQVTHTQYYATVRSRTCTWRVKNYDSPVNPIASLGNKLLAMTYADSEEESGVMAGVYYADTDLFASANVEREGAVCVPVPNDFAMSPSGRVYMLTCYEDRVEISELIFGE